MNLLRYRDPEGQVRYAAEGEDGTLRVVLGAPFGEVEVTDEPARVAEWLAPIEPPAVWGVGLNYRTHAEEAGLPVPEHPVVFAKGVNAVVGPGAPILLPRALHSDEVDYEGELAVVVGRACKNVTAAEALDYVLGYTCANDVSARDWQIARGGSQWSRGKSFDTFCPLGPTLALRDAIPDPQALTLRTRLNGETVQETRTADMIFSVAEIVAFLSGSTTLLPGTVVLTGTPLGVGMARKPPRWLRPGDVVEVEIEGVGTLTNPVLEEPVTFNVER
ncbi:MAG TPA: fumarylacetoacetate hydrolase family protein [Rubricoccaceae bacterium]|nr:fumarylacetoacetate hydrolase family protein [Rubricoccaceae bacterium]